MTDWLSTTFTMDLTRLAGTTQGRMRVLASDGFSTAQTQSAAVFSVAKHPPKPLILSPVTGTIAAGSQQLVLEGDASDPEDGRIPATALTWTSDKAGSLGTGRTPVDVSKLAEGPHVLTLTAKDADGQTGTATVTMQVARTRPRFPARRAGAVAAGVFRIPGRRGDPDARRAQRRRRDAELDRERRPALAEAERVEWVAPADVVVTATTAGLAQAHYTGTVQLAMTGVPTSTQRIAVTLDITAPVQTPTQVFLPVTMK